MLTYIWKDGDCIIEIAKNYNVTVEEIIELNQLTCKPNPGDEIIIKKGDVNG